MLAQGDGEKTRMNAFELNKYAGAVLAALLLIFGTRTALEIAQSGHGKDFKPGFALPAPKEQPAAAAAAPAASAFSFAKVAEALPKASADNGQATFKKCATCHTIDKGGANRVGPNLWGVVGRKAGSHEGFAYSEGIKGKGEWTLENLATFIHNPKAYVPSTKMVFAGIADAGEMADLLAYLRKQSDNPK